MNTYTVEVEISVLAQAFHVTMDAEGMSEEDAKSDAEEYVRNNIMIAGINADLIEMEES